MIPLKEIRLVDITHDRSKVEESLYMSCDEWRETLTPSQHVMREQALERRMLKHGMHTTRWCLEVFDEELQDWIMVSAMDSIARPAIVKVKGEKPLSTLNYVFDAVYTPKKHRGKGYAAIMLSQVLNTIAQGSLTCTQCGLGLASYNVKPLVTLWSDVGDYYTRFGFKRAENAKVIQSSGKQVQCSGKQAPPAPNGGGDDQYTLLDLEQSQMAIDYHRAMVVGAIDVMTEMDGVTRAIVAPTKGILDQMQWRSQFVSKCLGVENPRVYGARTENGWAAWNYMMTEGKLYILVMSGPIHEMVVLYQAALRAANAAGGFDVVLYEADLVYPDRNLAHYFLSSLGKAGVKYEVSEPDHSIPYYLESPNGDVKWEFAGRYSWF